MSTEPNSAPPASAAVPRKSKIDKDLLRIVALETVTRCAQPPAATVWVISQL